jgi:hypothetical protein
MERNDFIMWFIVGGAVLLGYIGGRILEPTEIVEKISYPEAEYSIGDIVWLYKTTVSFGFSGLRIEKKEWTCDTISRIAIYRDAIKYNGYHSNELYNINDSTQALCKDYSGQIEELQDKIKKLECK